LWWSFLLFPLLHSFMLIVWMIVTNSVLMRMNFKNKQKYLKISRRTGIAFLILIALNWGCSGEVEKDVTKNISLDSEMFLDVSLIEKAGFEHFKTSYFRMLINNGYTYLLNRKDSMLVRFNEGIADRIYKRHGQGPGEFLNPISIFLFGPSTIAAFDNQKMKVFLFDSDLNLKNNISVNQAIRKISIVKGKIVAFGDFNDGLFALLDKELKIIETFGEKSRKAPYKNLMPSYLYMGYLLNREIADTSWFHVYSTCKVDIIDPESKKTKISLKWKNPHPPTHKSIDLGENLYSIYYVVKHGRFYVVQNEFAKSIKSKSSYDLLLFTENGKLYSTIDFDYPILNTENVDDNNNAEIYYMDDSGSILYFDLNKTEFNEKVNSLTGYHQPAISCRFCYIWLVFFSWISQLI
jgi:hypothetical protein